MLEGVLWKKSSLCLRHLRLIEMLLFGTLFAFWTLLHAGLYPTFRIDEASLATGLRMMTATAARLAAGT